MLSATNIQGGERNLFNITSFFAQIIPVMTYK